MSRSVTKVLPPLTALPPISRLLIGMALALAEWDTRIRSRRALARLSSQQLQDIGLTTTAAQTECAKPFWLG